MCHYHPSASVLVRRLMAGEPVRGGEDSGGLAGFLDRFVYKNPKKLGTRGSSAMQPLPKKSKGKQDKLRQSEIEEAEQVRDAFYSVEVIAEQTLVI